MILATVLLQNVHQQLSKRVTRLQLTILAFCLILKALFQWKIIVYSVHINQQADFVRVVSSFAWIIFGICQYLGQPGLTNIKLHWCDLNHQRHLPINTSVLVTITTDVLGSFFTGILYQLKIKTVFNSLDPRPSQNYCFNTQQNEISISVNLWGPFCFWSGERTIVLIAAHSWNNIPESFQVVGMS